MQLLLHIHFFFYKINIIYALKHWTHSMNATPPLYFCPNPTTAQNRNRAPPISDSRSVFNVQNWTQTDTVLSWSTELVSRNCCYSISVQPVYPGCMCVVFSAQQAAWTMIDEWLNDEQFDWNMAETNLNPESESKHNLKILVQTQSGPLGTSKHRWARVWYSPCKEGWTAANNCAPIFIETRIVHRVKFGSSQLFLDFYCCMKTPHEADEWFSQTVTVEATKKHCAVTLRTAAAL